MAKIPNQALPIELKTKDWRKQSVEGYINRSDNFSSFDNEKRFIKKLYDYYHGIIDPEDYNYILKPYGGKERNNFPAELRTYPLIKPTVDVLLGEMLKRPFNFSVVINNPDVTTIKMQEKNKKIQENLYQHFVNKLNEEGIDTGVESEEVELPEHVEQIFERSWKDHRAIMAQNALRFLVPYLKWEEKQQTGWFDFLVAGKVISHRGIESNEPFYRIHNPIEVDYDKDPNVDFIEDGSWAVIREYATRASIVDRFRKFLTEEDVLRIQEPRQADINAYWNDEADRFDENSDFAEVCTVYWKSLKKYYYVTYFDEEFQEEFDDIVPEEEFDPTIEYTNVSVEWLNELWQGFRIDGDLYLDIRPHDTPRASIDNPSKVKLPINGKVYSNRNSRPISLVMLGMPFQITYDIFKYRLESAISRSKDMLAVFDINMLPEGWTMDQFMSVVEATGIAWVNYAKEGVQFNAQHQSVLDLSIKTIDYYINLLRYIREEWEQVSGVTRQRMGEMSQYEGKATSEQSIIQSSHITEDLFRKYNNFKERDLQALIDYSQVAWIDGKKGMFVMPDGTEQLLDIDEEFVHAEIGIHVLDSGKESQKIQEIKQLASVAIEQGSPMSMVASMIESDSFIEMKEKIVEAEKHAEEMQQAQQEMEKEQFEQEQQAKQQDRDHEKELKTMELNNKIELELIKNAQDSTIDEEWKKELEQRKIELQKEKTDIDKQLKEKDLEEKQRSNRSKEELERKKINKMSKNV